MRFRWLAIAMAVSGIAGVVVGEKLDESIAFRKWSARFSKRGALVAVVHGTGIYAKDLEWRSMESLVAEANAAFMSRFESISRQAIDRECDVMRFQIADRAQWQAALQENQLSPRSLRSQIARDLRCRKWLEWHLGPETAVGTTEAQDYFDSHQSEFVRPERFRAAHIFMAAPPGTADQIVDVKRRTMEELLGRIRRGDKFEDVAARFSEDDRTSQKKGDLGYFAATRMPDDFMAIVGPLRVGEFSRVAQTALGFHIVQLLDREPQQQMSFMEALDGIQTKIGNIKRTAYLQKLVAESSTTAQILH